MFHDHNEKIKEEMKLHNMNVLSLLIILSRAVTAHKAQSIDLNVHIHLLVHILSLSLIC